ncbi:Zn-ribbon domain-containing OB-fold protein [Cupriavidus sp. 2TAF22]|uniref:Zn-ribbon domain-containing OB-fold protein n=1 Tax=unclassified Cupriavidus TaxID=2640874 RepID=UPI003F92E1ED
MEAIHQRLWSQSGASLLASRERATGELVFPAFAPAAVLAAGHDDVDVGLFGTLYSFTVIHPNPKSGQAPYAVGYVDMRDQPVRIFGRVNGALPPSIGALCRAEPDQALGYVFSARAQGEAA